jgi:hypothetical protein
MCGYEVLLGGWLARACCSDLFPSPYLSAYLSSECTLGCVSVSRPIEMFRLLSSHHVYLYLYLSIYICLFIYMCVCVCVNV